MKIKEEYSLITENGQNIVVCKNKGFSNSIILSHISAAIFNKLKEKDCSKEELLHFLLDNFDISTVLALSDLDIFIKLMKENDILE